MTEENYNYRTSPFLLRNQFKGKENFQIPTVPKFQIKEDDFQDLRLIGFDKTKLENDNHLDRMVHFFLYDYKFERVWKNPDTDLPKLRRYRAVLTPDFSMYTEMAPVLQIYNTFRNRWCGAYYASKGIRVIPTVSWGNENTFEFCFDGIEKGSTVAVSTYMVSEHGNHKDQKEFFLKGYDEMLRRIEPETIIYYNEPFPEMQGNIVFVDYDLSSWRHMNDDPYVPSKYAKYICGAKPWPESCGVIRKTGCVIPDSFTVMGMGSAYGGEWRPKKEDDQRFLGEPGEVKVTTMKNGSKYSTKIGDNGKAIRERHWTDHRRPKHHSNPHDHNINWDSPKPGIPNVEKSHINYPDGEAPDFKYYEVKEMDKEIIIPPDYDYNFESISDFEDCMIRGGEVNFIWKGKMYVAFGKILNPKTAQIEILIGEGYYLKDGMAYNAESHEPYIDTDEYFYKTVDEALEYMIDGIRLRDIITEVEVTERTI